MQDELKPCPFCSSKAKLYESCSEELPYGVGCVNKDCHIYTGYGMKLYATKREAINGWNKRKRARAKFDSCEGDTCSVTCYDNVLYCSCGRALRTVCNAVNIQYKCPDCGRKIVMPENMDDIPVINTVYIDDERRYKATADGRILSGVKFLKPAMGRSGFPVVTMSINGKQTKQVIKYLIAKAFLGEPEEDDVEYVINLNGDVWDNRVENLKWVTKDEYARIENNLVMERIAQYRNEIQEEIKEDRGEFREEVWKNSPHYEDIELYNSIMPREDCM